VDNDRNEAEAERPSKANKRKKKRNKKKKNKQDGAENKGAKEGDTDRMNQLMTESDIY